MKYFKKLVGKNVYLSPMNIEDIEKNVKWLNDPVVSERLGDSWSVINLLSEKEWIENTLKKQEYNFSIVRLDDDLAIGTIGFMDISQTQGTATVGLFIGEEENRGKGYGTEALKLIVGYAFDVLNFNNIMLSVYEFNENAVKSYKKAGFSEIGRRRKAYKLKNKQYDVILMDITREDWYKQDIIH